MLKWDLNSDATHHKAMISNMRCKLERIYFMKVPEVCLFVMYTVY